MSQGSVLCHPQTLSGRDLHCRRAASGADGVPLQRFRCDHSSVLPCSFRRFRTRPLVCGKLCL